jgi:ribonuclease-3
MRAGGGEAAGLERALRHRFRRPELLQEALTHSSAASVQRSGISNERLEFLGDRVLGVIVAELLFQRFPGETEGELAPRFVALTRKETLARVAETIGLGGHLALSRGEEETGGRQNPGLLADACEAVIAALYLDGGMRAARAFINRHWAALADEEPTPPKDAKTALQEWGQARGLALPEYREVGREGPPHAPTFRVALALAGFPPTEGVGSSKRAAEQAAAEAMLERVAGGDGD